jgi:photosystem II stability/assembly factor-like uncharacterized protein
MRYLKTVLFFVILIIISCSSIYSQWLALNSGTVQNLNSIQFINAQTGYAAGSAGTVIQTTNGGLNWITLNTGSSVELRSIYFINSTVGLVCGYNGNILRTTNSGVNWYAVNSGTTNHLMGLSFCNDSSGICSGNSGSMLYTTNAGVNWFIGSPQGYLVTFYSAFMVNSSIGYGAGVNTIFSPLVAKTTNGGANWTYYSFMVNNNEANLMDIYFFDVLNGIAVSNLWNSQGGISRTTNGGLNWTSQIFTYGLFGIDFPSSATGYCVGINGYILKSTDGGYNWSQQVSGTNVFLSSVDFVDSLVGYTAGNAGTILKTTNGGITGISKNPNNIPESFSLSQNYPNPFNPATKIEFSIPLSRGVPEGQGVSVTLKIYDILGREIATLVNERLKPGTYKVEFDGMNFSSGVYRKWFF